MIDRRSLTGCLLALLAGLLLTACGSTPEPSPAPGVEQAPVAPTAAEQATVEVPPDPAASRYQLAVWSAKNDKPKDALRQLREVIALNPAYPRAYTNLGLLLLKQGDLQAAREALEQAIEQDKSDAIAYNHLAVIQRNEGEFKQALGNYRKAIELDAEYASAHLNLGILLDIYLQDLSGALRHYEIYQRLNGSNDERVEKWLIDLKRRIDSNRKQSKG